MSTRPSTQQQLALYVSSPQSCDYLTQQQSRSIFIAPDTNITAEIYEQLIARGFRRSGKHVYRPHCESCHSCISCRVNTSDFIPSRSQKRILTKNKRLSFIAQDASFSEQHYQLYLRYQTYKHPGGSMEAFSRNEYRSFLCESLGNSIAFETRLGDQLLAVSITDVFEQSLSAVYTFFDPDFSPLSLGTYSVLQQIKQAKSQHKAHVYLGYYVQDSIKMNYKANFRPLEMLIEGQWEAYPKAVNLPDKSSPLGSSLTF